MNRKAFSYDIVEFEKGIVFADSKEEAERKVLDYYCKIINPMHKIEFHVSEIDLNGDDDIIVTVPW